MLKETKSDANPGKEGSSNKTCMAMIWIIILIDRGRQHEMEWN